MSKCTINFDNNPHAVFYAGQTVSGTAELITSRPKTIRSIHITVNGYAEVRWTENVRKKNHEGKSESGIETFSATEQYISSQIFVYGQVGGGSIELPGGKYLFTFQTHIPPNAPTSFNGTLGQIRYEVIVTIDRPLRYDNVFKQPFTVISPFDLNLNPVYSKPLENEEEKSFCFSWCCGSKGSIKMKVTLPFSGYAPGQRIKFQALIDNQSDIDCSQVKVKLFKAVVFTCRTPEMKTRRTDTKIADARLGQVLRLSKRELNECLQIPSTPPTSLESCGIINISYTLQFVTKVSGLHRNIVMRFPLVIGAMPLYASINEQGGAITSQPGSGPATNALPPPSYEEDVNRKEMFKDNNEYNKFSKNAEFIPKYPVYYNRPSAAGTLRGPPTSGPALGVVYSPTQPSAPHHPSAPYPQGNTHHSKPHAPAPPPATAPAQNGPPPYPLSIPAASPPGQRPPYPVDQSPSNPIGWNT